MMNTFKTFLFAIAASFILFSGFVFMHHPEGTGEVYCNTRFEFCLNYPDDIFEKVEYSANADGITAYSEDGTKTLIAAGFLNSLGSTIEEEYEMSLQAIEYEAGEIISTTTDLNENAFETTVQTETRFVYKKMLKADDHYVSLTLKAEDKNELDLLKNKVFFTNQL